MFESHFFLHTTPNSVDGFTLVDQLCPFLLRLHSSLQVEEQDSGLLATRPETLPTGELAALAAIVELSQQLAGSGR